MFWIGGIGLDLEVDEMHRPVYFPPVSGTRRDLGAPWYFPPCGERVHPGIWAPGRTSIPTSRRVKGVREISWFLGHKWISFLFEILGFGRGRLSCRFELRGWHTLPSNDCHCVAEIIKNMKNLLDKTRFYPPLTCAMCWLCCVCMYNC